MREYIRANCPILGKQIDRDIEAGTFDANAPLAGDAVRQYMGALAGREIRGDEVVWKTCDEIELKLEHNAGTLQPDKAVGYFRHE